MSLASLNAYLKQNRFYFGLRPASTPAADDDIVPVLSGPDGGMLVEAPEGHHNVIDVVHEHIHEGNHFVYASISPVLNTATYYWKVTTPNTAKRAHFTVEVSCNVLCTAAVYRHPTVNVAGAADANMHNSDHNSATLPTLAFTKGDTSTADGTLLWSATFGGSGLGQAKTSGNAGSREEMILKQNEEYFIKVTSLANGAYVDLRCSWYEV